MDKKYEFTGETIKLFNGKKLHRIKALRDFGDVKAGELGGFIEKEDNLSHKGDAWVYGDAWVCNNAKVYGSAKIYDNVKIYGNAKVYGNAEIYGNAKIYGNAWTCSNVKIYDNVKIYGYAKVYGCAKVRGNAEICNDAIISGNDDYICFKGFSFENRNITMFKCLDDIKVRCGCFGGTLAEFEKKVGETHGDSKYAKEYLACIEVAKIHFGIENDSK